MEARVFGQAVVIDESFVEAGSAEIRRQLRAYEAGSRRGFDLEVDSPDTFTGRVMDAIAAIPYGSVRTYGEIAEDLDSEPVAVGQAAGRNPAPILVPCHRVVAADGLGGYSGPGGRRFKQRLLDHEGADLEGMDVDPIG
jgi:methylated-DNA-[protein]-cysteine S-methyltransferase